MKTNLLFLMLLISIGSFSQECPCVKTAIIGTDVKSSTIHNNKVVAMDNITIKLGESINLFTKENTGKVTWYKDGKIIRNTLVSPTKTIEYTVKSSLVGCPEASAKVQIQVKQTPLDNLNNEAIVFPNPTNDHVTISANNKGIISITITNLIGGSLKTFQFDRNLTEQSLNISDLATGVYIVRIEVKGNKMTTKKLIKN
jgi:hypothetical protein